MCIVRWYNAMASCCVHQRYWYTIVLWFTCVDQSEPVPEPYYRGIQDDDGHWASDYGGPMFLMPGLIISLYVMVGTDGGGGGGGGARGEERRRGQRARMCPEVREAPLQTPRGGVLMFKIRKERD